MNHDTPITDKDQLVRYFEMGCKVKADWSIGTESEQFIFQIPELIRAPYEGRRGIQALLNAFQYDGWQPIFEKEHLIALKNNDAFITLEPAGQFELSGAKLKNLHECFDELQTYHKQLNVHLKNLGLALLSQGVDPKTRREDMPWMPKERYEIMRSYMPTRGNHGLDMMSATAAVQVNLDYSSEQDCARKFRVAMALSPLVMAMFANSPIHRGKLTGLKCFRKYIWTDTDPDRSGILPFAFEEDFTFEKYVDYALDVPMYFVYRDGIYHNHAGHSFRDFMKGNLPGREGELPLMKDFQDHLSTAFPEVRLKQYIELRGADSGPILHVEALSALWTGLLYDQDTLNEIHALTLSWTYEDCLELQKEIIISGLQAKFIGQPLYVTARKVLDLAQQGLENRGCLNMHEQNESIYLDYLEELIGKKECPADRLIQTFIHKDDQNVEGYLKDCLHQATFVC